MWRRSTAALAATLMLMTTAALAGCGGEEATTADGPAQAVPAEGALVYAEALVRPEGDRADGVREALRKVARRDDVLDLLVREVNSTLADEAELTYEEDIEPWLGERAGIFFLNFEDDADGAVILDAEDEDAAQAAIEKARQGLEEDSQAELIDGRVVIGSRAGVEAAKKAAEGDALADADRYSASLEPLDEDRLGHVWVDVRATLDAVPAEAGAETYKRQLADVEDPYAAAGFDADSDRIALELAGDRKVLEALGGLASGADSAASPLLGDLPADAWLAFGVAGAGRQLSQGFTEGLREAGPAGGDVLGQIEQQAGVDLQADLFDQVRDLAFHMSGTGLTSLGAGALIGAEDPERALGAIRSLVETFGAGQVAVEPAGDDGFIVRAQGAPFSVQAKRSEDRIAIALGADAADRLLEPKEPLRDSEVLDQAAEDLGDDANVSGFLQFGPMIELVNGLAGNDPDWQQARPYVEAYERLSFGDRQEGDWIVSRIVAKLR